MENIVLKKIETEIDNAQRYGKGLIIAKMNSLVDMKIIEALYKASQANVKIKLMVRGMCCLIPQVKGMSDNISVISIVDRFLEHSRIYYFYNNGGENIYLSSADWMERNFDRRIETLFPVEDEDLKKIINDILNITLSDNVKAKELDYNGKYSPKKDEDSPFRSQIELYNYFLKKNTKKETEKKKFKFIPIKKQ
jgi:polyphosphate kinase